MRNWFEGVHSDVKLNRHLIMCKGRSSLEDFYDFHMVHVVRWSFSLSLSPPVTQCCLKWASEENRLLKPLLKRTQPWKLNWNAIMIKDSFLNFSHSHFKALQLHHGCPGWALNWPISLQQVFIEWYHSSCQIQSSFTLIQFDLWSTLTIMQIVTIIHICFNKIISVGQIQAKLFNTQWDVLSAWCLWCPALRNGSYF